MLAFGKQDDKHMLVFLVYHDVRHMHTTPCTYS